MFFGKKLSLWAVVCRANMCPRQTVFTGRTLFMQRTLFTQQIFVCAANGVRGEHCFHSRCLRGERCPLQTLFVQESGDICSCGKQCPWQTLFVRQTFVRTVNSVRGENCSHDGHFSCGEQCPRQPLFVWWTFGSFSLICYNQYMKFFKIYCLWLLHFLF